MLHKKWFPWLIGAIILLLPAPAIVKSMQGFIIRNGVVTSWLYTVHAPVDGMISGIDSAKNHGSHKAVLSITNHRKTKYYRALQEELDQLKNKLETSEQTLNQYKKNLQQDIDVGLNPLKARLAGAKAKQKEAEKIHKRKIKLLKVSAVSEGELDQSEAIKENFCLNFQRTVEDGCERYYEIESFFSGFSRLTYSHGYTL